MINRIIHQVRNYSSQSYLDNCISLLIILFLFCISVSADAAKVTDFIPSDSIVFLQLNDIDEIYNEIQTSEDWEQLYKGFFEESDFSEFQQGFMFVQTLIGTNPSSIFKTIGYQSSIALWKSETDIVQSGIVIHSGGNLAELQRLTKILSGFMGMSDATLKLDVGKHEKVKYNTLQFPEFLITYGFVNEFLVVGIGENSFAKLIDTYRKKLPSIQKNGSFSKVSKKYGDGQLSVSINVPEILPLLQGLSTTERNHFEAFNTIFARINLLEVEPVLKIYTEFTPNLNDNIVSMFLKEGSVLQTFSESSGDEDLFIAISPGILETLWKIVHTELENTADNEAIGVITFFEGVLNLNLKNDIFSGLTGELALIVNDLTLFEPSSIENLDIEFVNIFTIDAENVQTDGGLIFVPKYPQKWDKIGNSLSKLQNSSVSHIDYKGTNVLKFASNIHYAESGKFSLLSFSEEQMYSILDRVHEKRKNTLSKQLPKNPLVMVKLNLIGLVESIDGTVKMLNQVESPAIVSPVLGWITVNGNKAVLELTFSGKETPLEELGKILPYIISNLNPN